MPEGIVVPFASTYERWLRENVDADPRLLKVGLTRSAEAMRSGIYDAPVWAAVAAMLCSAPVGLFGNAPVAYGFAVVALVALTSLARFLVLQRFYNWERKPAALESTFRWSRHFLILQFFISSAWGANIWLLWQSGSLVNNVFLCLASLAVVTRFLVTRGGQFHLFFTSVAPLLVIVLARFAAEMSLGTVLLGGLVLAYTLQLVREARRASERMASDAHLRFINEDMARDLEEARDEALKKRFEAETANASKTAFLANMSHELRTPLNAILGFSEIIARECLGPVGVTRYKEYANDIHNSGTHLLSLINDLLDVAKIEAGRMEIEPHMIESAATLEDALKLVAVKARERNQTLSIEVDQDADAVYADERAFKQIAINLVSNSVKFTPEGGRILVRVSRLANGDYELMVEDTGSGIPKDKLDRIFLPFSQIDNRFDRQVGGTGLGLALVRGLAELHGGRAWVESEEGKGARVFVIFPSGQDATLHRAIA
ncbi:MAG: sensor histidine kinase [Alphaproteobacteria bacterium]